MSKAMACDQCGEVLVLNDRGDSAAGEEAGWLTIGTIFGKSDLCTRACAVTLLEDEDFIADMDAGAEIIADLARSISGVDEDDE